MNKEFYLEVKSIVETIKAKEEREVKQSGLQDESTLKMETVGQYMLDNPTSLPDEVFLYEGYRLMR
jgi:hypothetical protein